MRRSSAVMAQRSDSALQLVGSEATLEIRAQAHFAFRLPPARGYEHLVYDSHHYRNSG